MYLKGSVTISNHAIRSPSLLYKEIHATTLLPFQRLDNCADGTHLGCLRKFVNCFSYFSS